MIFKQGSGWKACYDEKSGRYTAEYGVMGGYHLYEITEEAFALLDSDMSEIDAIHLIHDEGRHLYMDVNDRCGPPYSVVLDDNVLNLCPWAEKKINSGGPRWGAALTDAAVELFDSEEKNREQRRKKREQRLGSEKGKGKKNKK